MTLLANHHKDFGTDDLLASPTSVRPTSVKPTSVRNLGVTDHADTDERLLPASVVANREAQRLAALRSYDIMDTPAEPRFDRVARMAAQVLETPIALISFLDETRQWV